MKKFVAVSFLAFFLLIGTAKVYALNVPRSENAKPADQASEGLANAAEKNTNADEHVPA